MLSQPRIIPTPQAVRLLSGREKVFAPGVAGRILCAAPDDARVRFAVRFLHENLPPGADVRWRRAPLSSSRPGPADLVLLTGRERWARPVVSRLPGLVLRSPAREQGYTIRSRTGSPVILHALTPVGLLYAVASLLQVLRQVGDGGLALPNLEIQDVPEFAYRGNDWLSWCEAGQWSYDRGDGLEAYEKRILRKLDFSLLHKVNLIVFDGFGWDPDRMPGYAGLMRRMNRAARLRGIALMHTGYGSGYGAHKHYAGKVFRNRERYPDGPVYACCGNPAVALGEISRTYGTCMSNPALTRVKQEELETFVRRVEPGALYIHNVDCASIAHSEEFWAMRCERCRRRWPNDDVLAADGMAGAVASLYDSLADAVNRVSNRRSDYRAERDCLLVMVSPGYTDANEDDRSWRLDCRYFAVVSRLLRNPNILFGLREQFFDHDRARARFPALKRVIDRDGRGHRVACLNFATGGDCFKNSYPFAATAALNPVFKGVDMLMHLTGTAYQEPMQLVNAEYGWNPSGSAFHVESMPADNRALRRRWDRLSRAEARPPGIFGRGGLLDEACARLYGPEAAPYMATVYRMRGARRVAPFIVDWHRGAYDRTSILLPVWNVLLLAELNGAVYSRWCSEGGPGRRRHLEGMRAVYCETAGLNRRGARLAEKAAGTASSPETSEDAAWIAKTLRVGARLLD
ncbi:MAG: hypothetical protein HQ559_11850, partial [Lentisphaerae bacterium]|nr:hypothetical protein [Lentisphaerota bacterium]